MCDDGYLSVAVVVVVVVVDVCSQAVWLLSPLHGCRGLVSGTSSAVARSGLVHPGSPASAQDTPKLL